MADKINFAFIEPHRLTDGSYVNNVILRDLSLPYHSPVAVIHAETLEGAQAICDAINRHAVEVD